MKRIALLVAFIFGVCAYRVAAQPTFFIVPDVKIADEGEFFCVDVRVEDFTDILGIRFSINWDPGVITYQGVQNLHPGVIGLDMADFNENQSGLGILTFDWSNGQPCIGAISGVTLPDNVVLFQICFFATGDYGNHTFIDFTDDPLERYVTRLNANCNDIGEVVKSGYVSVGTPPVTINITSADGFADEIVCLDFTVENFDSILSFQHSIRWNAAVLEYQSFTTLNLADFKKANVGTDSASAGILTVSWNTLNLTGETLSDGTQILQVCFKIIGNCGQSSSVYISDSPSVIEVVNFTAGEIGGNDIGLLQQEGFVSVNCFNPNSITIDIDKKEVCPGETFFIDVRVSDFDNISKLQFHLKYNENIIALVFPKVSYPDPGGCFFFPSGVNTGTPGLIKVDWTSLGPSCTLNDGFILMRLHFQAVGSSGNASPISVVEPIFVDEFGAPAANIGINNNNGLVSICQIDSPTLIVGSTNANPGDTICLPVTAKDFEMVRRMQFTMSWEKKQLQFLYVTNFNMPDLDLSNFFTAQATSLGIIGFEWETVPALDLPDNTVIFELCFRVVGNPGDCGQIIFADIPYPIEVITTTSDNTNIGLNGQQGTVCITNPFIFEVVFPDVITGPGSHICVDVRVNNFKQLTLMDYTIAWNPTILQYDTVLATAGLPNFTPASYDDSPLLVNDGLLDVNWLAPSQIIGFSVPDGNSAFQICFDVLGDPGKCSPLTILQPPFGQIKINSAPTGSSNLGMAVTDGSVCISAKLSLVSALVTDVDCPGTATGAIDITVGGGSGSYQFEWQGTGVNPTAEDQTNLLPGTYKVTVTDVSNPGLFLNIEYTVALSFLATIADAGADTTFACGNFFLTLNGSGSSSGTEITYLWESIVGGGLVLPGEQNKQNPKVIGGQCYRLTVTNITTGCVAIDEVCVAAPQVPFVEAESSPVGQLDCTADTVELDGSSSSFGFQVIWTTDATGSIAPGTETSFFPLVTTSGWYFLTLSNPLTGCTSTDSVYVVANFEIPVALADTNALLGCDDNFAVLSGDVSTGPEFTYTWTIVNGGDICGPVNEDTLMVCAPGEYQLLVTNTDNGCTASDVFMAEADTLKPAISAGLDTAINCFATQVELQGSISSGSGDYTIEWQSNGGNILSGQGTLQPTVDVAAVYTLVITDNSNGCVSFSEMEVRDKIDVPEVVAVADGPISCFDPEAELDATGSSTGPGISYEWYDESGLLFASGNTVVVANPGEYKLLVVNADNGCKDSTMVLVDDWTIPPLSEAGDSAAITCTVSSPQLNGLVDPGNPNLIIQWAGPVGNCLQNGNSPTPIVSCIGMYVLTVFDTLTGCIAKDTTWVLDDMQPPGADAGPADTLTCAIGELTLSGASNAGNVDISWESIPPGLPILNPASFNPQISSPGTYVITVTSQVNGCSSSDLVAIGINGTPPSIDAGQNDTTTCIKILGTINASSSDLSNAFLTWNALSGSIDPGQIHDPVVTVGPGVYELILVSGLNGCEAKDTVSVVDDSQLPTVVAADQVPLGCTDLAAQLNGTGSETGDQITYQWTNEAGLAIGTQLIETTTEPGFYTLTVSNADNGCSDSITIEVVKVVDAEPADAVADGDPCSTEAMLIGNLPDGATGVWSTSNGAIIEDPSAATTLATNLSTGSNSFTWTLSLGSCQSYSSAIVTVAVDEAVVNANFDQATLKSDMGDTLTMDLLKNDVFGNEGAVFDLLAPALPVKGLSSTPEGIIEYVRPRCFAGTVEFSYRICSNGCPEVCDTTSVRLAVQQDDTEDCDEVANGITPNGDGVNDAFIIDVLLNNPDKFPNNEIIIFNRWGDIVYQAKPYLNDWRGTNNSGQDLPQATYYYILTLNIANSQIIRGDVTILR